MNFFETLIRPDLEENPERAEVARAANLLQIGEFQLLQLAHHDWFGTDMTPALTDRLFAAYMLHNRVPHWARHYARHIIALDAAGVLDDRDPAYHRYDRDYRTAVPDGVRRFLLAAATVTVFVAGGLWVGHLTSAPTSQILPPYFTDAEINGPAAGPPPTP